jgi:hypothetical protein
MCAPLIAQHVLSIQNPKELRPVSLEGGRRASPGPFEACGFSGMSLGLTLKLRRVAHLPLTSMRPRPVAQARPFRSLRNSSFRFLLRALAFRALAPLHSLIVGLGK